MRNILFLALIVFFPATSGLLQTRFKSMKCTVLNKTVLSINFCYVKAYSRDCASLNWEENRYYPMGTPLEVIIVYNLSYLETNFIFFTIVFLFLEVKVKIQYRYGTILRDVVKGGFDLCSFGKGKTDNLIANTFWAIWEKSVPTLFQGCPFKKVSFFTMHIIFILEFIEQGVQRYMNVSYDDVNWPSPIPSGMYRAIITIGTYWVLEYDTYNISDIKTSF